MISPNIIENITHCMPASYIMSKIRQFIILHPEHTAFVRLLQKTTK